MTLTVRGVRGYGLLLGVVAFPSLAGCPAVASTLSSTDVSNLQTFIEDFLRQVLAAWLT